MKILGIDYGHKRIGLAISDETQTLARELAIVEPKNIIKKLSELIAIESVEKIVVGLPLNMSGEPTHKTKEVLDFIKTLQKGITLPIVTFDERLSSVMAEGISGQKEQLDSLAAQIILQNYLDKTRTITDFKRTNADS